MSRALLSALVTTLFASCYALQPTSHPAPVVRGPLSVGTNAPLASTLMQFHPRSARTADAGTATLSNTLSYSSMFENGTDGSSTVVLDGEIARDTIALRSGLGARTDVEVQVPFVYASSGFLDGVVESWHELFGFPNGGRERRPKNEYEMRIDKDGRRVYSMDPDTPALGDVPVFVTHGLLEEARDGVGLALTGGVELPLGSESRGFGNGGVDWGGGVILERSFDRFTFTGGAYHVFCASPDRFRAAHLEMQDQTYLHAGIETRWNDVASILVGLRFSTAATKDVTIKEVDSHVLELDVGCAFEEGAGDGRWIAGLSEDLIAESGPDWTLFVGWSRSL